MVKASMEEERLKSFKGYPIQVLPNLKRSSLSTCAHYLDVNALEKMSAHGLENRLERIILNFKNAIAAQKEIEKIEATKTADATDGLPKQKEVRGK